MSRCGQCKKYSVLHNPREIGEGIFVYGFCFKDVQEKYGAAYPVYVPDGGVCKSFERKKAKKEDYEYEMTQEFKCECCKKTLIEKISNIIKNSK